MHFVDRRPGLGRIGSKQQLLYFSFQVVPKALELIHEWSKCGGASSLTGQEPDLRISDSLQDSNKLEILKEWEEKMEVEGWNTSATSKLDSIFFSKEF